MKYLLDASAFILLIKNADVKSTVEHLQDSSILDLTFYEIGNAIWKESTLTKFLTTKEAEQLGTMAQTVLAKINRVPSETEAFQKILEIAQTERLSYYDSSYIYFAKEKELPLITEDKELRKKANKYVDVRTIATLLSH
jgi:predicted nucleic acid-binding protein